MHRSKIPTLLEGFSPAQMIRRHQVLTLDEGTVRLEPHQIGLGHIAALGLTATLSLLLLFAYRPDSPAMSGVGAGALSLVLATSAAVLFSSRPETIAPAALTLVLDAFYTIAMPIAAYADSTGLVLPAILLPILIFPLNSAIFKGSAAVQLNGALLVGSVLTVLVTFRGATGRPFAIPDAGALGALLLVAVACANQALAAVFHEKSVTMLAAKRQVAAELEEKNRLLAQNLAYREELARLNRMSLVGGMSASISHEMNQPIGSALTFAQAAIRWLDRVPPNNAEARHAVAQTIDQLRRTGEVIDAIRRMSARTPGESREVRAEAIVLPLLELLSEEIKEKAVSLVWRPLLPPEPSAVLARGDELGQVLLNLITNALESFDEGGAARRISVSLRSDSAGWIEFTVEDNGRGIAPGKLEHVFDRFYTTKPRGTGLGLAICHEIAQSHGGTLDVVSTPGAGTTATLRLPLYRG